jgi:hypothetical protein
VQQARAWLLSLFSDTGDHFRRERADDRVHAKAIVRFRLLWLCATTRKRVIDRLVGACVSQSRSPPRLP